MRDWIITGIFLLFVIGGGTLAGTVNQPGQWYAELEKPFFNPPAWVFGPVWTVLYVMIAVAGARTWRREPAGLAMQLWFGQLALNFLWTPVFFGLHMLGLALAVVVLMLLLILVYIVERWQNDWLAALLFVPYAAWVSFASLLNGTLYWLN